MLTLRTYPEVFHVLFLLLFFEASPSSHVSWVGLRVVPLLLLILLGLGRMEPWSG